MRGDTKQFAKQNADNLCTLWDFCPGELLYGEQVGEVVVNTREVIDTVGVREVGMKGLPLRHFLCAAVVKTDIGYDIDDSLSVQLKDKA